VSENDQQPGQPGGDEQPHVVVRDRRRIDPQTGEARIPDPAAEAVEGDEPGAPAAPADPAAAELKTQLDERTADLQRLTAEYANYRKRVERDREANAANAKASLATQLLGVLDDVERAAAHGDLTGAFKTVADKLASTLQQSGLAPFGHEGEPFDPSVHEAVQHDTSPDVTEPTVTAVLRRGYRFGDRVVRAALVAVTDHGAAPEPVAEAPAPDVPAETD
jgi:molecular chaperone GrpE